MSFLVSRLSFLTDTDANRDVARPRLPSSNNSLCAGDLDFALSGRPTTPAAAVATGFDRAVSRGLPLLETAMGRLSGRTGGLGSAELTSRTASELMVVN